MVLASAGGGVTAVLFDILIVLVAAKVAADQEAGKLALRSAKEVQASLPREIADAIDRRLAGFVRTLNA